MKHAMSIDECKKEHLREVTVDEDKIKSIIKVAAARLKAIKQIKRDAETSSIVE